MKPSILLAVGAVASALLIQNAQADLLFSDDFNGYTTGGLGGQGTWNGGNAGLTIVNGGLTYGSLYTDSSGNAFQITQGAAGSVYNTFANQTSGTIYYSFLFDPTAVDSANNYFTALNPGTTSPGGSGDAVDVYYYSDGHLRVRGAPGTGTAAASAGTGPVLTLNTTYFIVEEIDLDNHTASLWVNPDSSTFGNTAPTATATISGLTAAAVDNVGFKAQTAAGGPYLIDNILIGTSWADVTTVPAPVPEPSIVALSGVAFAGLAAAIRRRRK